MLGSESSSDVRSKFDASPSHDASESNTIIRSTHPNECFHNYNNNNTLRSPPLHPLLHHRIMHHHSNHSSSSRQLSHQLLQQHNYTPLLYTNDLSGKIRFAPLRSNSSSLLLALASSSSNSLHLLQFQPQLLFMDDDTNMEKTNNSKKREWSDSCQLISSYFEYHTHDIQSLEWYHHDFIFSSSLDCTLCQYDVPSSKLVKRLCVTSHSILNGITLSPQESPPILYICCNNSILMWDTREKKHSILVKPNSNKNVNSKSRISNDYIHVKLKNTDSPHQFIASRGGGVLEFRDLRFQDCKYSLYHDHGCEFTSLEIHPYYDYILTYCEDGIVYELFENYNERRFDKSSCGDLVSGGGSGSSHGNLVSGGSGSSSTMNDDDGNGNGNGNIVGNDPTCSPFKKSIYNWYSCPSMKNNNQIGFKNASYSIHGNYMICGNDDGSSFIFDTSLSKNDHFKNRLFIMDSHQSSFLPPLIYPMKIIPSPPSNNHHSTVLNSLIVPNMYDQSEIHNLLITYEEPSMYLFGMSNRRQEEEEQLQEEHCEKFAPSIDEAEMVQDHPIEDWQHNSIQSETKVCSFSLGYVTQIVYVCLTCYRNRNRYNYSDEIYHGVCEECSKHCHRGHELYNIGEKRNFKCDCGNSQCGNSECLCSSTTAKPPMNERNPYNHNFKNEWCYCGREEANPMYQCYNCYDWFHGSCIFNRDYDSEHVFIEDYSYVCENCWNLAMKSSSVDGNDLSFCTTTPMTTTPHSSSSSSRPLVIYDSVVIQEYPSNDTIVRRGKFVKLSATNDLGIMIDHSTTSATTLEEGEDLMSHSSDDHDNEEEGEHNEEEGEHNEAQQGSNLDDFIVEDDVD
ncbi:hypothetical protein C9374_012563 [Naegleria lovaniensis]|uniref:UBR-type domain-containing protein n=1 Tax=Naegleria lovaniensis TaxID=51637 RepID=A0AA88H1D5_NAELO|nr:uncharacterized protein C9374_012563 [Naegleria lovaniensis]KAG2392311.1 hypothetical protein C9374_012563 [Naegleria lovaniensis]